MSALSLRISEASKNRHFLYDGFPKPHHDQDRTQRSLLFGSSPSTRASSPFLSSKVSSLPPPLTHNLTTSTPPPQTTTSTSPSGSKTNAFFGSAWAERIPTPAPPAPPTPVQRSHSLHSNSSDSRSSTKYGVSESSDGVQPHPRAVPDTRAPSRSQTADFFNGPRASTPPPPPPSIRSITSSPERAPISLPTPSPSPIKPSVTPPETSSAWLNVPSFFSGRASGDVKSRPIEEDIILGFPDALNDPLSRLPSLHRPTTGLAINYPSASPSIDSGVDDSNFSRSSSRSSVSGFRRDFNIGPSDSGYQALKPGPYEREDDRNGTGWVNPRADADPAEMRTSVSLAINTSPVHGEFHAGEHVDSPRDEQPAITTRPSPQRPINPTLRHPARTGNTSAVRRETCRPSGDRLPPEAGTVIGDDVPFELLKPLGQGAFSSVWLARDVENRLLPPLGRSAIKQQRQKRRKSASMAKKLEEIVRGIKPSLRVDGLEGSRPGVLDEMDGKGACWPEASWSKMDPSYEPGRVVAIKMMDRSLCDANDRTRISFVREVEVLRHISHPSIVSYLHSFTTQTHHCLVLEQVAGGELFELMNSDENHARMTEPLLRRMWGELCKAVGWMHGVALVHRDIKLENILLTVNPFQLPGEIDVNALPHPLVKLTDFGLARFVDPKNPMLVTRCGSEAYAAPEIVTGSMYDGRKTDAWACGVVLYALATRSLPFDRKVSSVSSPHGYSSADGAGETRRSYLVRIAQGVYTWPEPGTSGSRLSTAGVQKVVGRLLVRDPTKRAWIWNIWDEEWMEGEGAVVPPKTVVESRRTIPDAGEGETALDDTEHGGANVEGMLVDQHNIGSVASQELL